MLTSSVKLEVYRVRLEDYPDVLKVEQVAEILNIGINQAYHYVADGTIPSLRFGRSIRISKAAIMRLLEVA